MQGTASPTHQGLVVFAKDKQRVSKFYRETLGLRAVEEAPAHDLLVGDGVELVIHAIPRAIAATIEIESPPRVREDTPLKPTFVVRDLEAVRRAAEATGGGLGRSERAWTIHGMTVLDGYDPEGNVVQFKQPQAIPEPHGA